MGHFFVGFVLVPLLIVVGAVFLLARLFSGAFSRSEPEAKVDETRMIQEIYTNLSRMEDRVDVLETLLFEAGRKGKEGPDETL
ncbi:MAG: hypothetical protein KKE73_06685 [Proteobacteria bacterium]|nr:hypothetical protein [Pseudomonadota bacterium]